MPWSHCDAESILDAVACPKCGITKVAWTLEWNRTRTFQVPRKKAKNVFLRVLLVDKDQQPVPGEPYAFEGAEGRLDEYGTAKLLCADPQAARLSFPRRRPAELPCAGAGWRRVDAPEGVVVVCELGKQVQHRLRLQSPSPFQGLCAWSRPRAHHGGAVMLGFMPAGPAPDAVSFEVTALDDAASDPVAKIPAEAHDGRFVARARASFAVPGDDASSRIRFRFRALDGQGRSMAESEDLEVLVHRMLHF